MISPARLSSAPCFPCEVNVTIPHRLPQRLEFHYTPKHASWLSMVEIEIGVLPGQRLNHRIGERDTLVAEIEGWRR